MLEFISVELQSVHESLLSRIMNPLGSRDSFDGKTLLFVPGLRNLMLKLPNVFKETSEEKILYSQRIDRAAVRESFPKPIADMILVPSCPT